MTPAQFREARVKIGLSAAALGRALGVSPSTVRRYGMEPPCSTRLPVPRPIEILMMSLLRRSLNKKGK